MLRREFVKLCGAAIPLGFLGMENAQAEVKSQRDLVLRFSKIWKEMFPQGRIRTYECLDDPNALLWLDALTDNTFNSKYFEVRISHFEADNWKAEWFLYLGINPTCDSHHFGQLGLGNDLYDETMWQKLPNRIREKIDMLEYVNENKSKFLREFHEKYKEVFSEMSKGKWKSWGKYLSEGERNRLEKTGEI